MYVFEIEELKARDLPGISKAMDIALSRMIYPQDMRGWNEGDPKVKIEKRVHMTKMTEMEAHTHVRTEPDEEGYVILDYAFDLVAMRYIHFLLKKKVEELTGIPATNNDDVDWDFVHEKAQALKKKG